MVRTQIYLTDKEREGLNALAKRRGRKQSELIREAVDGMLEKAGQDYRKAVLAEAAGLWKDRTDLPDFAAMRKEWDRR